MKKIKLFLGLVIIIFASLIVYQNRDYFFAKQALSLDLGVETWLWTAPGFENLAYFGVMLLIGFLFAGFMGLSSKLKSRKMIKTQKITIKSHQEMINSLKNELQAFRNDPYRKDIEDEQAEEAEVVVEKAEEEKVGAEA